jgi:poly-gamma-glutamate synthase PgsB/CapB
MSIVAVAAKEKAHVLLLECMALDPSLQHVCEHAMLRSTIGVITNVRPDHLEVMGSSPQAVAEALSHTIPAGGVLVTEKGQFEKWFRERARRRGTAVCTPAAQETPRCLAVDDPALAENLALVRSIGITAGIRASEVDDILTAVREKEGRSAIRVLGTGERRIALVDGFSINDTVSAEAFQQSVWAVKRYDFPRPWVALLNARTDRPIRTREFCRFLAAQSVYDAIGLGGRGRFLAWRLLRQTAIRQPLFMLSDTSPAGILQSIGRCTGSDTFTIVGLGNHRGIGETLRGYFEKAAACS